MIPYLANKIFFAVFFKYLVVTIFICKNDKFSTLNLHRKTWRIFSSAIYKNQSVILYWYYIHILIIIWYIFLPFVSFAIVFKIYISCNI